MRTVFAALLILAAPLAAKAQESGGPDKNGNVYGGTAHEPSPGAVQSQEKAAGIAPPPATQQRLNNDVDSLGQQILRDAADPQRKAACAIDASKC